MRPVLEERRKVAGVATARRLDLDDVGAEIAEDLPAQEPAFVGEVEYAIRRKHSRHTLARSPDA
jgi:hypothetical protein